MEKPQFPFPESLKQRAQETYDKIVAQDALKGDKRWVDINPDIIAHMDALMAKIPYMPDDRERELLRFFEEWCINCPILLHLGIPDSDLEDVAGALCPEEVVHSCPILLQLRDLRAIGPPEGWTPENNEEFINTKIQARREAILKGEN